MKAKLDVYLGRTNIVPVTFGIGNDISGDSFVSEIREQPDSTSVLIVAWTSSFATDGTDGELVLTLDDAELANVTDFMGYMDIKRISGGEPLPAIDDPIEVFFKKTVTA